MLRLEGMSGMRIFAKNTKKPRSKKLEFYG